MCYNKFTLPERFRRTTDAPQAMDFRHGRHPHRQHDRGVAGCTAGAAAPLWPHRKTRHPRCSAEHGDGGGRGISHPHLRSAPDPPGLRACHAAGHPGPVQKSRAEARRPGDAGPAESRGRADVHLLQHLGRAVRRGAHPAGRRRLFRVLLHRTGREEQSPPRGVPRSPRAAGRQRTRRRRRLRGRCLRHPYCQTVRLLPHRHRGRDQRCR